MNLSVSSFDPIVSVIFGILILVFPSSLNYLIAIYLILSGLLGLGVLSFG